MAMPANIEFKPILALAGPTASGKTAAALAIACEMAVEIISCFSAIPSTEKITSINGRMQTRIENATPPDIKRI